MFPKLVSHRAKAFAKHEQSLESFTTASQSMVPYIEIDLRCSKDGTLYVYHDPDLELPNGKHVDLYQLSDSDLNTFRFDNGESLMTLERCFEVFLYRRQVSQQLCLDIKDFGFEEDILSKINQFSLMDNVIFVSWIPQTLFRLKELNVKRPLILSCYFWPRFSLGHFIFMNLLRLTLLAWGQHLYLGKHNYLAKLTYTKGKHVAYCSNELPKTLLNLLKSNNGGICIHHEFVNESVKEICRKESLQLWTYPIKTISLYKKFENDPVITAILCDNAPEVLELQL